MSITRTIAVLVIAMTTAGCEATMTSPTPVADTAKLLSEFSSQVIPGGSASRQFEVTTAGPIAVTLKSTTPGGVTVGVGVGIPRANGSCALSAAVEGAASAQISINAEKGTYCAKVYDLGALEAPLPFTISITHP